MKTTSWIFAITTLVIGALLLVARGAGAGPASQSTAQAPTLISYQGTLADENGQPISQTVTIEFALYNSSSATIPVWGPESQEVRVTGGLFRVVLGTNQPIDPARISGTLYLGIRVNGEELLPRELMTSVASAIQAQRSAGDFTVPGRLDVGTDGSGAGGEALLSRGSTGNNWMIRNDLGVLRAEHDGLTFFALAGDGLQVGQAQLADGQRAGVPLIRTSGSALELRAAKDDQADSAVAVVDINSTHNIRMSVGAEGHLEAAHGVATPIPLNLQDSGGTLKVHGTLDMTGHAIVNCGALTEANLLSSAERSAGRIDRFEEGDVLCWGSGRLEKCDHDADPLVQAVADANGKPIILGAEVIKVIGPVTLGDYLVASSVPGYAQATGDPAFGTVIAQALEDFDGERGLIKAMIRKM